MNYGLYLSASGVLANSYRQDVFANNLANINTVAFKPDLPSLEARPAEAIEDDILPLASADELLVRLGGGVKAGDQRTSFAPGPIKSTGRPLDVALSGSDRFLAVRQTDPDTGETEVRLTRDGRLSVDRHGHLVTMSGQPLLDPQNQPILVDDNAMHEITRDGRVFQDGQPIARLQIVEADTSRLSKAGENLYAMVGGDARTGLVETPDLQVGHLESSSVEAITALMAVTSAAKAATANAKLIKYHDSMMDGAINTLGRVG